MLAVGEAARQTATGCTSVCVRCPPSGRNPARSAAASDTLLSLTAVPAVMGGRGRKCEGGGQKKPNNNRVAAVDIHLIHVGTHWQEPPVQLQGSEVAFDQRSFWTTRWKTQGRRDDRDGTNTDSPRRAGFDCVLRK